MAHQPVRTSRSIALGALTVVVLALLVSLLLLLGRGGCAPAIAFDRPIETDPPRPPLELAGTSARATSGAQDDGRARLGSSRGALSAALGPVRGYVVDAATRELVPHVEVELRGEDRSEVVLVGDDAAFASVTGLASGELEAIVRDAGVEVGRATIAHDAARGTSGWRVEVPIGPTIRVATVDRLPFDPAVWRARIRESALDDRVAGEIDVGVEGLSMAAPSADLPDRDWPWLALRPGPTPWARYPLRVFEPVKGVDARVELRDDAQNRKGRAPIRGTIGIQPAVDVTAEDFGGVAFGIERPGDGASPPMRAVLFDAKETASGAAIDFEERSVTSNGSVVFTDVEPGSKTMVAWSRRELVVATVRVSPGPTLPERVRADRLGRDRPLDSKLMSSTLLPFGWSGEPERIHLVPHQATKRLRAWISHSDFEPDAIDASMPNHETGMTALRTIARFLPDAGAAIEPFVERGRRTRMVRAGFRVTSASSGATLPARVAFGPTGHVDLGGARDAASDFAMPEDRCQLAWSVWSEGMQPAFAAPRPAKADAGGSLVLDVPLEPGVGYEILLRAGDPAEIAKDPWPWTPQDFAAHRAEYGALAGAPVAGVRVEVDTYANGASDANGAVRIRHPILPRRITLVAKGWRVCALDALPGGLPRYVAWLRRNP